VSMQAGTVDLGSTVLRQAAGAIYVRSDAADGGVAASAKRSVNVEGGSGLGFVGRAAGSVGVDLRTEVADGVAVSTGEMESGSGRVVMTTGASAAGATGCVEAQAPWYQVAAARYLRPPPSAWVVDGGVYSPGTAICTNGRDCHLVSPLFKT
jgi:hypothetical protein